MLATLLKNWNQLELVNIEKPPISSGKASIKVRYAGVCGSDITVYRGQHPTAIGAVVLCHEILGTVDDLPADYSGELRKGDRVLVNPVISCKSCPACKGGYENVCDKIKIMEIHENGGFAEYTTAAINRLVKVNPTISDEVAALGEPFAVAYHVNSLAGVKKNDKVLVIGAGTIGIVVALTALEFGAGRVIISEINNQRLKLAASFGLETINPSEQDIFKKSKEITDGTGFDVVYDASGSQAGLLMMPDLCCTRGTLMSLSLSGLSYEFPVGKISFREVSLIGSRLYTHEHFKSGVKTMEKLASKHDLSIIVTDIMPFNCVSDAIESMKTGKNVGKILIDCKL